MKMRFRKNKKGVLNGLMALVPPLVGVAIVIVVGFLVISETQDQLASNAGISECKANDSTHGTFGCNASITTQQALGDVPEWLPVIVIVVIGALLITLVRRFQS